MAVKLLLSRLPVDYGVWRRLNLFRHGRMDVPAYSLGVFRQHYQRFLDEGGKQDGYAVLELGPGDSLNTALIARAHGARTIFLVDATSAAHDDIDLYRSLADYLKQQTGYDIPPEGLESVASLIAACEARYLTHGLASLREIPENSIDFVFSQAVLEHVRRSEFDAHLRELHRILKPDAIMSHRVDFKDHLGGGLNNLRFSHRLWESPLFVRSGFYTNRLRASEVLDVMQSNGFACKIIKQDTWPGIPIRRERIARELQSLSDDDLKISGMDIVCRAVAG
jgi:SAM-dependent methyltransferase